MNTSMNTNRRSKAVDFERVQAHYDVGDDFYALFLDESMTYSCAKFDTPTTTLADAQRAKIDLSLGKCELSPGMTLLDIGCGWGGTARRAAGQYGAKVTGLTLSQRQFDRATRLADGDPNQAFRLEGWETYAGNADRIVSIGAMEHFGRPKYPAFFAKCREVLPADGVMLLHTITAGKPNDDWDFYRFVFFINTEIFPGGDVPPPELVIEQARLGGFEVDHVESLRPHYARTLDCWAANLESRRGDAIKIAGVEQYERYMKYLTGCATIFRTGEVNVHQFKLRRI